MTIFGWDASDFDHSRGPMDMQSARSDGIDFYTHKAAEGTSVRHHPGPSMAAARAAGIPFLGCYLVPRSGLSIAAQVDYFLGWVDQQVPWWREHPGWFWQMDTEHWGYDNVSASVGHQAAQLLAQRTGKRVLHYAPKWAYGDSVPAGEPLWASNYVTGSGHYRALYPGDGSSKWAAYSGRTPAILQYTSSATIGRQTGCDANAFRGTVADFAALIGGGPVVAATSGKGDEMIYRTPDGACYVATVNGPVQVLAPELKSMTSPQIMQVENVDRVKVYCPAVSATTAVPVDVDALVDKLAQRLAGGVEVRFTPAS